MTRAGELVAFVKRTSPEALRGLAQFLADAEDRDCDSRTAEVRAAIEALADVLTGHLAGLPAEVPDAVVLDSDERDRKFSEGRVRVRLFLDRELVNWLGARANQKGMSASEQVCEALRQARERGGP